MTKISFVPWLCSWPDSSKQGQGFPRRFWSKWCATYRRDPMLHLFCGASTEGETRVDIREGTGANLIGDYKTVIIPEWHHSAFADPPYTQEFADEWGVVCPRPSDILRIMKEACLPGAYLGILHLQVIRPIEGLHKIAWHPVFSGTTKHLRCLSVFKKESQ